MRLVDAIQVARWIVARQHIWQMRLLEAWDFARFASDRGLSGWRPAVNDLWRLGLLRADLVVATSPIRRAGLVAVGKDDEGRFAHADARSTPRRKLGWANAARYRRELPKGWTLLFHPFRYYVLFELERTLDLNIVPMQVLWSTGGYRKLVSRLSGAFARWSRSADFSAKVDEWNALTLLAVAVEPCEYEGIFRQLTSPAGLEFEVQREHIAEHRPEVLEVLRGIPVGDLEGIQKRLCFAASILDPNDEIHTLLRLSRADPRVRLKGRLGGAIHLRTMAEMIRRATESAHVIRLPEEDEVGHSGGGNLKTRLYGTKRLLDGDRAAVREFLRQRGLDYGVRLRWYVEGETEYGAVRAAFPEKEGNLIEVVNLRGHFSEHVPLREALRADLRDGTFSLISLDGDRRDAIRVVRKAAEADEMCGMFFVHYPDFEFANFEHDELLDILWQVAVENGAEEAERDVLRTALKGVKSGEALFKAAAGALPALAAADKGRLWGERLIRYAVAHPHRADGTMRPIVEAVSMAMRSGLYNYQVTRREKRTDPQTGRLIGRSSTNA